MSYRTEFKKAVTGSTLVRLLGVALAFLVGIQLARGLGIENYGLYGMAMAMAALGSTIASGGIQLLATRETAAFLARDDAASAGSLMTWSFRSVALVGIPVCGMVIVLLWIGKGLSFSLAAVSGIVSLFAAFLMLAGALVRGTGRVVLGQALDTTVRPAVYSVLLFAAALLAGRIDVTVALALGAVACVAGMLVALPALRPIVRNAGRCDAAREDAKRWRNTALTMGLSTVLRAAEAALPLILIGFLATLAAAGAFRVAASTMVLSGFAGTMITIMVPAMAAQLYARQEITRLKKLAAASCLIMTLPSIGIAAALFFFGRPLLAIAFGVEYSVAWAPMMILTASMVVMALGGINIALLHVAGYENIVASGFFFSLLATAGLCLWLIPEIGAEGAALAILIAVSLRTAFLSAICWSKTGINPTLLGSITILVRSGSTDDR